MEVGKRMEGGGWREEDGRRRMEGGGGSEEDGGREDVRKRRMEEEGERSMWGADIIRYCLYSCM